MINSVPHHHLDSAYSSLSASMITPQKAHQIQSLNFNLKKKSSINSGAKHTNKPKPSTDRTHVLNDTFKEFNDGADQVMELHNNQKADLLEKRKQYAESVREKNRCSLKEQKSKNKKSLHNQTLNLSLSFTPPKDLINEINENQSKVLNSKQKEQINHFSEIEKEYYSLKKFNNHEKLSNSKVFAESNVNLRNSLILMDSHNNSISKDINCSKLTKMIHNASVDMGLSHRDGNHSERKNLNNKENKPQVGQPGSARKNTSHKYTSYAEIFDKKSSMNGLIQSQKSKGAGNTASRQMGSIKKDKSALKSMATPEQQLNTDFRSQFSLQLDTFVNGFTIEGFNEQNEEISRIKQCVENDTKLSMIVQNNDKIEQESVDQTLNEQPLKSNLSNKGSFQIFSQTINEVIDMSQEYEKVRKEEQKQLMILAKQNGTFKRELASFRKENSTLRKELQKAKEYILELELKAKKLIDQQAQFMVNQEQFIQGCVNTQGEINLNQTGISAKPQPTQTPKLPLSVDSNLEQILISTEQQLFSLKSTNKALQLKVYMLEKKLSHQEQLNKKRLALQVHNWRDKYNKLRNQNIKLKNSLHPFNSDLSFSMDISRDQ